MSKKMFSFFCQLLIYVIYIGVSSGQNDKFEYECDILARLDQLETELKVAKDTLAVTSTKLRDVENQLKGHTNPGSTYVRWGRTTCPGNGTELVYSGLAGGSYYKHSGAGANYICLPKMPIYGNYTEDTVQGGGYVYGAEYELDDRIDRMAFFPNLFDRTDLYQNDVPCSVCRTHRSTVLMVPAQNMCMDGWTLEYRGLLVGEHTSHSESDYICLDDQPEYISGGGKSQNGKLLYFVEGRCGTLPCPPYVDGRELTCAVCTK